MARTRKEKNRDDRDFDQTQLRLNAHGKMLHRDYTAHFFRWSYARRLIKPTDHVLDIGCGTERPLSRILFNTSFPHAKSYCGVDLNMIHPSTNQNLELRGGFDFVARWKELQKEGRVFDVVVHNEVIEHMLPTHGRTLLKGCFTLLRPGGLMLMSTPCYDGVHHAANHIHEYTIDELMGAVKKAGFVVEERFGTFMDLRTLNKKAGAPLQTIIKLLGRYYDNDALSNIFAPLFPDDARNNLWVCRKPEGK